MWQDSPACWYCGRHGLHWCSKDTGVFFASPLTEERVREIIREEIDKARGGDR